MSRALTVRELRAELAKADPDAPVTIAVRTREDRPDPAMYCAFDAESLPPMWGGPKGQVLLQAAPDGRIGDPLFGEPRVAGK